MMRRFIHVPVGLFNVALIWASIPLGLLFGAGFVVYEVTQGNEPYIDIKSWLWGLGIGGGVWFVLKLAGVI